MMLPVNREGEQEARACVISWLFLPVCFFSCSLFYLVLSVWPCVFFCSALCGLELDGGNRKGIFFLICSGRR